MHHLQLHAMAHDDHVISIAPPRLALLVMPSPSWSSWSGLQTTPTAPPLSAWTGSSTDTCKEAGRGPVFRHCSSSTMGWLQPLTILTEIDIQYCVHILSNYMLSPYFVCACVSIVCIVSGSLPTHPLNSCRPPSTKSGIVEALTEQVRVALHGLLLPGGVTHAQAAAGGG